MGNTDRHWGVLVDNTNSRAKCLHKLIDYNQAFHAYDDLEGANCQMVFQSGIMQREAAGV